MPPQWTSKAHDEHAVAERRGHSVLATDRSDEWCWRLLSWADFSPSVDRSRQSSKLGRSASRSNRKPVQVSRPCGRTRTHARAAGLPPLPLECGPARRLQRTADGSPIFNGDFADPSTLKTANALYLFASNTSASRYAPAAHIPEIQLTQSSAFQATTSVTPCLGCRSGRFGLPVGSVCVGAARRYLRDVLLDPGDPSARLHGKSVGKGMHPHRQRPNERNVHFRSYEHNPDRSLRRRLVLCVHLPRRSRWCNRSEHLRRAERDALVALEE